MAIRARITFERNPGVVHQMQWAASPTPGEVLSWVESLPIFRWKNGIADKVSDMIELNVPRSAGNGIVLEVSR